MEGIWAAAELMDSSRAGLLILDREQRLVWANRAAEEYLGFERARLLGSNARESLPPVLRAACSEAEALTARLLDGDGGRASDTALECHVCAAGGRDERWLEHRSFPVATGELAGGRIEHFTDVTHRRRAEQALEARTREQAAVARLGQRALTAVGLHGLMQEAVEATAEVLGVEYCKVLELLPGGEELLLRAGVGWKPEYPVGATHVSAGLESQAGYTLLSAEPLIVPDLPSEQRFSGPPLLHEHGVVSGMSVIIGPLDRPYGVMGAHSTRRLEFGEHEIEFLQSVANILGGAVARTQAETAVRESEERLRAVIETAVDGIITIDPTGIMESANPAVTRIFGYTQEELLGRNVKMLMPEPYRSRHDGYLDNYMRTGERKIIGIGREVEGLRRDGSVFPLDLAVSEIRTDGRRLFTGMVRDITDRRRAEAERELLLEELRAEREHLRELNEHLEERVRDRTAQVRGLAYQMSFAEERERRRIAQVLHDDVQQMLVALQMTLQAMARSETDGALSARALDLVRQTIGATRSLSSDLGPPVHHSSDLADSLLAVVRIMSDRYGLEVALEVEGPCPMESPDVRAVVVRLVRELLFNVVKHAGVMRALVRLRRHREGLEIEVEDQGAGFDPARLGRVGTSGYGLTGIGDRLELLGGTIRVETHPGQGTRVVLTLPEETCS